MIPPRLKKEDKIGIVAPSNFIKKGQKALLKDAVGVIKNFNFEVELGKYVFDVDKYGVSAGEPQNRAEDINRFFTDDSINAIWCMKGGECANEVLEFLDFELIKRNPKIFIGMSDNSVLLNSIYQKTGLVTFYGPDLKVGDKEEYFDSKYSQEEFIGRLVKGRIGEINKVSQWRCVRKGSAKGKILGGHLRCFLKLAGTEYFPDLVGGILCLEGNYLVKSEAIHLLTYLKHLGVFEKISGAVVGFIYGYEKEKQYDKDGHRIYFEDLLFDYSKDYSFPILKICEFGHKCPSTFLPIGGIARLDAEKKLFKIVEKCVR